VEHRGGYYYLASRAALVAIRRERAAVSKRLWRRARRYARLVAGVPFVRLVAVTGALAMDNVGQRVDVDLLVATEPGRVWIARAAQRLLEIPLRRPALNGWERWELRRLRRKLAPAGPVDDGEVIMSPSQCKGHTGAYRRQVLERYQAAIAE